MFSELVFSLRIWSLLAELVGINIYGHQYTRAQSGSGVFLAKERENNVYKAELCSEYKLQCFGSHKRDRIEISGFASALTLDPNHNLGQNPPKY